MSGISQVILLLSVEHVDFGSDVPESRQCQRLRKATNTGRSITRLVPFNVEPARDQTCFLLWVRQILCGRRQHRTPVASHQFEQERVKVRVSWRICSPRMRPQMLRISSPCGLPSTVWEYIPTPYRSACA